MEKKCPIRHKYIDEANQVKFHCNCRDDCAWYLNGECAIVIIAKANLPFVQTPSIEPNKCDMEREWLSEDEEEQNYVG